MSYIAPSLAFTFESAAAAKTHVVRHNLGTFFLDISIWRKDTGVILYPDVVLSDADTITINFAIARDIRVILRGR